MVSDCPKPAGRYCAYVPHRTAIGLALSLLLENEHQPSVGGSRPFEIAISLIGFGISLAFVIEFIRHDNLSALGEALFLIAPSGSFIIPHRTDQTRAIALVIMACGVFSRPLVYSFPPFVSVSILLVASALYCMLRSRVERPLIKARIVIIAAAGAVGTVIGIYGLVVASRIGSPSGILIFSVAILFFGGGAALRIAFGDNWRRRRAKR